MKDIFKSLLAFLGFVLCFTSCERDTPHLTIGLQGNYYMYRMQTNRFVPGYTGDAYRWLLILPDGTDSLLSTEHTYCFLPKDEGVYNIRFQIIDSKNPYTHDMQVTVMHELVEYSPYISRVLEYRPAPGQFVNEMPLCEEGDTEETMRRKVEDNISGRNNVMITLGGFGGYVTFGFDHTVMNVKGEKDFLILGNAFYELTDPDNPGGSSEPGIVMVAFDKNQNGVPDDDEWYELAGSEYYKPETTKNYEITYFRPDKDKTPIPDETGNITDQTYIKWTDNYGDDGYIQKIRYNKQDYFPKWISGDKLTFRGTKLKDNGVDQSGYGAYWVLYAYGWGYADNRTNNETDLISFDIDWAVDSDGNKVHLPGIDFVRVYTAVNQTCGWIGETSTEILGARDLHIYAPGDTLPEIDYQLKKKVNRKYKQF
ncbi:hypothetical protein M2132_000684 [Dysgonomonas sp. PH5-45]|uniref:cell surface protein n=1 Tax=unclassified Dysgonomonas TaxID=2630389 RepID=UPI002475B590|nr:MULTISPECIES: cell surface protein [unclassified Dysgonomonas]MDH6354356.1 hypothetical protein [Dysgonomonas sp. PH5-45]MDH6387256.1 hypothetical protein [Dysgonomonas sp. PH5-37]